MLACCSATLRRRKPRHQPLILEPGLRPAGSLHWPTLRNGPATGRCRRSHRRLTPAGLQRLRPARKRVGPLEKETRLDPAELVPEPWSRWGEWGMNLIVVGAWLTVLLLLVYFMFGQEFYGLAFLLLLVGGLVAVVLSYPMLITLERPVRITPEQAMRELLWRAVAPCPALPPDVAAFECRRKNLDARSGRSRGSRGTGRISSRACARDMPGH